MSASPRPEPPRVPQWLLARMLPDAMREPMLGDLAESFALENATRGGRAARWWYWRQALLAPVAFATTGRAAVRQTRRGDGFMTTLVNDVRIALRSFARRPGFAAIAVLTAALGVGATTVIYSAAYPILFAPLPYPHGERIVSIQQLDGENRSSRVGYATIVDVREQAHAYESVAAVGSWSATLTSDGPPVQYNGLRVTPDYFSVLGVHPALGHDFEAENDVTGAPRTVILSDAVWRTQFASASTIVNRTITLNDFPYRVVGVMPAGFENAVEPTAQLWRPLQYNVTLPFACRGCQHLRAYGRMRPGTTVQAAANETDAIFARLGREHAHDYPEHVGGAAIQLADELTRGVRPAIIAAFGAVLLVLLIACVNVTNLLLGRVAERRAELAVRTALGASRARIIRQLLVESTLLSGAGGVLGVAFAAIGVRMLVQFAPLSLPRLQAMHVSGPVLAVATAATMLVGLVFGLLPAISASKSDINEGLMSASRRSTGGSRRVRSALVVAEMALAVLVLAGSGLLLQSMRRLLDVRPGFEPSGMLALQPQVIGQQFASDTVTWRYYDRVVAAVSAVPGVEQVALTSQLPLSGDYDASSVHSELHPNPNPESDPAAHRYAVSPGYIETMRIPIVRGRTLDAHDDMNAPMVVLVNASFAKKFFPGEDAVGQRIRIGPADSGPWRMIVGITGDVHQVTLAGDATDAVYVAQKQWKNADGSMWLVVRTHGDPASFGELSRRAVWSVDKNQPIARVATIPAIVNSSAAQRRFVLSLFEIFALISIALAALGMYGVLAASVAERLREIGIREALGASPRQIIGMIVSQGMFFTGIGAVVGVVLSLVASRALVDQLFQTSRVDPVTYGAVLAALGLVALGACAVPAIRAARVDPMESLRAD